MPAMNNKKYTAMGLPGGRLALVGYSLMPVRVLPRHPNDPALCHNPKFR